jgi:hypothetical protein
MEMKCYYLPYLVCIGGMGAIVELSEVAFDQRVGEDDIYIWEPTGLPISWRLSDSPVFSDACIVTQLPN